MSQGTGMTDEGELNLVLNAARLDEGMPVTSERLSLQGLPWRLMVVSQDVVRNSQGGKGKTVGVFVQCVPDAPGSHNWSASAHVKIKLLNHSHANKSLTKAFDHNYSNASSDWGFSSFIKWKDLSEPSKGFLKDGEIVLEASIQLKCKKEAKPSVGLGVGSVDPFLSCPGCTESFETSGTKQPMSLKCGHTYCSVCLTKACDRIGSKISLKCATCRQLHTTEDGKESSLWFPNHSVIQIISNMLSKSKYVCQIHHHDKNYYCFDDQALVCIYCAYHGDHASHVCKHMDEARKEASDSLRKTKASMSSHVSEVERKLQFVKDERELLKSQESSVHQLIETSYEQLKAALLRQRELLFLELKNQTSEISSNIDSNLQKLEQHFSKVQAVLSDYTSWTSLPARDALERYTEVQSELSRIPSLCREVKWSGGTDLCPNVSFQMTPLSEMVSFGQLGRVIVGDIADGQKDSNSDARGDNGEVLPLSKKRKTDSNSTM